jgi:putative transposase
MRALVILFVHGIATFARTGGIRSVAAESVLVKQQLLILNRSRQWSPNLRSSDRLVVGMCALFIRPGLFSHRSETLHPIETPPSP